MSWDVFFMKVPEGINSVSKAPIDNIRNICIKTSWKAIDSSSGDFMDFDNGNPQEDFYEWKCYKDAVTGGFGTSEVME